MTSEMTFEQLWVIEEWELARQILVGAPEFEEFREEIEYKFDIDLEILEDIVDLPDAGLRELQERILASVESFTNRFKNTLYDKVCVEWEYCKQKNSRKSVIAEYIASAIDIAMAGGALTLAIVLMKREYLDKLCHCPESNI